jgi:glycosyltransferase involved in cell wall biosynthesis
MRLLFITDNFPPEVNAPANRTYEHCREWVKSGVDVTVITCAPNFPKGEVYPGYKNKLIHKEVIDGIKVIRVFTFITANEGIIKRTLDYVSFAITAFFAGLFVKTDIIISTSPQFFTSLTGRLLSFFKRKPWIFEVRDIWPESIIAVGIMERNNIIRALEKLEKYYYRKANHIVVVTDSFKQNLIDKGVPASKISIFKNGANLDLYKPQDKNESLLKQFNLKDKFIFAYIGTHGMAHGLDFILNSIQSIQDTNPKFHFIFIGDGAERINLLKQSEDLKLKNVTFINSVNKKDVVEYLSIMDVAIVNLKKSDTFLNVIPSKIFEAAAMEKPILLGLEGETKKMILEFDSGICYEPENENDFIKAMNEISNTEIYQNKKTGAIKIANIYDRKIIADQMLQQIKKIQSQF